MSRYLTDTPVQGIATGAPRLLDRPAVHAACGRAPISGPAPDTHDVHELRYGERPRIVGRAADWLLAELEAARLTGCGGAHFPSARKWHAVLAAGGGGVVVANAAEGESASAKDAALLQHRPHLVLDGLAAAAETVAARRAVLWLHEGADDSLRAVYSALAERRAAGLAELPVEVVTGPDHYLTGESSAVVRALDGGPALPSGRGRRAARHGVGGRPTLVHNVETLARVGLITRFGGHAPQPGPLLTVVGQDVLTVMDFPPSCTLADVWMITGGDRFVESGAPPAVLIGGFAGVWAPWAAVAGLPLAHLDGAIGPSLGAGIVAFAGYGTCGVTETARVLAHLADSSAQQCGPCVFGMPELADLFARLAAGTPRRGDATRVAGLAAELRGRGACGMPDGAVRLATSCLETFGADVESHRAGAPCLHAGSSTLLPVPAGAGGLR